MTSLYDSCSTFDINDLKTIILTLTTFVLAISCDQKTPPQTVYKVEPVNMQGLRTKKDTVQALIISRKSIDDSTVILFPSGGTETEVVLHRQFEYKNWKSGKIDQSPEVLRSDYESVNDSIEDGLRIDLTGLPDGNYVGEWITCSVGGYTVIELKTKK